MSISENLHHIQDKISHIHPSTKLIAVSKRQPEEKIEAALEAGHRIFGENRVQEACEHWEPRRSTYKNLELHLIGPLQTNKVKEAVALFDVIQTLDREKLARKLASEMQEQGRALDCFIQVNTGAEEQKSGILPQDVHEFYRFCKEECGLKISGLMCIPPIEDPPALHFAFLKKLARQNSLESLSMGMSNDYEKALKLGATHIRVGSEIFGERTE